MSASSSPGHRGGARQPDLHPAAPKTCNALSVELVEALIDGVDAAHREQVPLLVFAGAAQELQRRIDSPTTNAKAKADLLLRMVRIEMLLQRVASSPRLTRWRSLHGRYGAGVDLFAPCKGVIAPGGRLFACRAGSTLLGTRRFRDIVGADQALSILGSAVRFDADQARRIGFVRDCAAEAAKNDHSSDR